MNYFDHENLDVYNVSIELVVLVDEIVENLPRGRSYLADQLLRAGTSVPLNIAEGAGEYSVNEKIRFYRIARRSATESASILDVCKRNRSRGNHLVNVPVPVTVPDQATWFTLAK